MKQCEMFYRMKMNIVCFTVRIQNNEALITHIQRAVVHNMTHCLFCSTTSTRWVWYLAPASTICSTLSLTGSEMV